MDDQRFVQCLVAVGASASVAQQEKNAPTFITTVELGDVKVRYLNFKWDEKAFEALEKGGDLPAAQRSWAIARLFPDKPILIDGIRISGGNLLMLHPARGETPMTFEVRVIDIREIWEDPNVIAVPPEGRRSTWDPPTSSKRTPWPNVRRSL